MGSLYAIKPHHKKMRKIKGKNDRIYQMEVVRLWRINHT